MKKIVKIIIRFFIALNAPITFLSLIWLKIVMKSGIGKINDALFMYLGILPVLDHYYQPLINPNKHLKKSLKEDRNLTGINFNIDEQLDILSKFDYNKELLTFPLEYCKLNEYFYNNSQFNSGDSEYLYNMIRYFKPKRIIEIGCGYSTLMIRNAIYYNKQDNINYDCNHICIEPYEVSWLEKLDVELQRERVENINLDYFQKLEANDILFIDSSHIIMPQGDVLFEYLELLPTLKSGVFIHIHDIFTPKDYNDKWIRIDHLLWNEQYLLEAFLTYNSEFRIIGSLNYLTHNYYNELSYKCPILATKPGSEPGSFWMTKNSFSEQNI